MAAGLSILLSLVQPVPGPTQPDAAERQRVVHAVIANLKAHYADPALAQKMEAALVAHHTAGDYDTTPDGAAFAALLTRHLRDVSHDLHLEVIFSRNPLPSAANGPPPEMMAAHREAMERNNCTFEKVEILPHNIGYVKLNSFPVPASMPPP